MPHLRCRRPRRSQIHLGLVVLYILWNEKVVSENSGTPKSSILIGFSIINHPIWGTPIFGNTQKSSRINMCQHALSFGPSLPSPPHAAFPSSSGCPESGFVSVCIFWPLLLGIAWDVWKEATTWIYIYKYIYISYDLILIHFSSHVFFKDWITQQFRENPPLLLNHQQTRVPWVDSILDILGFLDGFGICAWKIIGRSQQPTKTTTERWHDMAAWVGGFFFEGNVSQAMVRGFDLFQPVQQNLGDTL